jgi:type I restriction enzyme S subunit
MSEMDGWIKKPLSEVADITMGQSPDSKFYSEEDVGMPFLQGCAEFGSKFPSPKINCTQIKKIGKAGSILFSVRAPVGKTNLADRDYIIGRGLASILATDVDSAYLEQFIAYVEPQFRIASQGSTFEAINSKELSAWPIEFPYDPVEQTKIASILSTLDRAIEQTEAIIAKQQRIKAGLMQELLTKGIDEHGVIRSEATHQFKDSPLGRIPVEWEVKAIGEVFTMQLGKMLSKKAVEGKAPFPYLGNKNVQWDYVDLEELLEMDFTERERQKFELLADDILVCEGGEVGRTALWRGEHESCYFQKAIHRLRPIDEQYLPKLFPRFMRHAITVGTLLNFTSQTSIAHLTQEQLATLPISVPKIEEQKCLVVAFDRLDENIGLETSMLGKMQNIKAGLMHDLLTGTVRVN